MSRRRTNKMIGDTYHRDSNLTISIYLTPDNKFESDQIGGHTLSGDTFEECERAIRKFLDENIHPEWIKVIHIDLQEGWYQTDDNAIHIEAAVEYYAQSGKIFFMIDQTTVDHFGLQLKSAHHRAPAGWRGQGEKKFSVPVQLENHYYLPYSEDVWLGVQNLILAIRTAKQKLRKLLADPNASIPLFEKVGKSILMLPGGEDER